MRRRRSLGSVAGTQATVTVALRAAVTGGGGGGDAGVQEVHPYSQGAVLDGSGGVVCRRWRTRPV